jgi:hypothetical protein
MKFNFKIIKYTFIFKRQDTGASEHQSWALKPEQSMIKYHNL